MKLFGFDIQFSRVEDRAERPTQTKALSLSAAEWLRGQDAGGGAALSNAYEQVVWVYRAINVLAEQVANVPFLFSRGERGREDLITSGPLLDFYGRPHPQINRFQYWELRVIWLLLRGECFRIPIFDPPGGAPGARRKLRRILLLEPSRFQHIVEDHELLGWRYTGFGPRAPLASQVFLPEEVWFEKLPNPFDFWRGLSPLQVVARAAQIDFAAGAFMQGVIENNADNGLIVRTERPLGDEQQQQIMAALRDRKRRAGQADRPVFLNGITEVIRPQLSSSDLQFLENRKFSRAEICAAFGVPEEIVGTTDHAKYDVMAGARLNFLENRVAPLCSRLEAEEDCVVKAIDPLASGWFDLDSLPLMKEARRSRLVAARTGFDMGIPFNELNRVLDLGFKPLPWGDRGYLPAKLQQVGEEGEGPRPKVQNPKSVRSADTVERARELLEAISPLPDLCSLVESKLRRFFFEQRQRALKVLNQLGQTSPTSPACPVLDVPAETARLAALLQPVVDQELARRGVAEPQAAEYLAGHGAVLEKLVQQVATMLEQALTEGLQEGEAPASLAARIKTLYNHGAVHRALEFARVQTATLADLLPKTNSTTP